MKKPLDTVCVRLTVDLTIKTDEAEAYDTMKATPKLDRILDKMEANVTDALMGRNYGTDVYVDSVEPEIMEVR